MILLLADIHFKLGQPNVPVDWSMNRYFMFFDQVKEAINKHNITTVVIAGDTFDRFPKNLGEVELYVQLLEACSGASKTYIISGNHEATKKGHTFLSDLTVLTQVVNNTAEIILAPTTINNQYHLVPYEYIKKREVWDNLSTLPVFTHVRGAIEPHVKPEIDLKWLEKFPIVYAGDLHSYANSQGNIVYPGEPMTTSFHRTPKNTGYIVINDDDGSFTYTWHKFNLPQLIRKTVSSEKDIIPTEFDHTVYELEGTIDSLATVVSTELLDKKITKRKTEVALILDNLSIDEELKEYLLYILNIDDARVEKLIEVFNEYNKTKNT